MSDTHTLSPSVRSDSSPTSTLEVGSGRQTPLEKPIEKKAASPKRQEEGAAAGKEQVEGEDPYLVKYEENDKENPRNWPQVYRAWITLQLGMLAFTASLGSSIISPANATIATYVDVSTEIMIFSVSLYLLGFAFGPMLWAPISETWGRRLSILPAMTCLGIFSIGTAVSKNAESVFITRFFGGLFASAPVSNVTAAMGDLYSPYQRGTAIAALTVNVSWRWTEYLLAIVTFAVVALTFFCLPELYAPVILKRRAIKLRKQTGDERYHHPHEEMKLDVKSVVTKHFSRPLKMLFTEPMIAVIAVYASFVYSILYMSLEWVPIIFEDVRGWSPFISTLPFIALFLGILAALGLNLGNQPYYHRQVEKNGGKAVPEARLPPIMIGSVLFCGGLFWLGWTATPNYHWILPSLALAFIGAGFSAIFQQCINFLIDSYPTYAASAVSGNTILRSFLAAGLPFAVQPMYKAIGVADSLSILGAVAGVAIPVPWLFRRYGAALRKRSKYGPNS
jgi:MFS family permease